MNKPFLTPPSDMILGKHNALGFSNIFLLILVCTVHVISHNVFCTHADFFGKLIPEVRQDITNYTNERYDNEYTECTVYCIY